MVTDVSGERITSMFRVEVTLNPEDGGDTFSETEVTTYKATRRRNPEDHNRPFF
jgi:hypothetical protein